MQQPHFYRTSFHKKKTTLSTPIDIFHRLKKTKRFVTYFPHFTWKLTEKKLAFFVYQKLKPQYTIFNRQSYHRKNVDPEFQNPAALFCHFCMILFYLDLTKDSIALLEDNTLNHCIN